MESIVKNVIELETRPGDVFSAVALKAKQISTVENKVVQFDFNGCICRVSRDTNLDWLYRDFKNHSALGWKTIGENCVSEYSNEIKDVLETINKIAQEKADRELLVYENKQKHKKLTFIRKTEGVKIELSKQDAYENWKAKNKDEYGSCVFEYAEGWAILMQLEMSKGKLLKEVAEKTSYEMDFLGITGYMYNASVQILSQCWKYGEELKDWHFKNK